MQSKDTDEKVKDLPDYPDRQTDDTELRIMDFGGEQTAGDF
jgi:hypothetical protein